jgi:hypothetical protein
MYQRLKSTDYAFDAMSTTNSISAVTPTNEQSPTYQVHVFGLSYLHKF